MKNEKILTKKELCKLTTRWGLDRKIITNGVLTTQILKLGEELAEYFEAKTDAQRFDAIGDMVVVLTMISGILKEDLLICEKVAIVDCPNNNLPPHYLLVSIYGLLCSATAKNDTKLTSNCIGFMVTVLDMIATTHDTNIEYCWTMAYNEIKDRTGTLLSNGCFVKD